MHPTKWLWERFKTSSDVRDTSCCGISPSNLLDERSNDSSTDRFCNDAGIWPSKTLWDKFKVRSPTRSPIMLGIWPSNLFLERSIIMFVVKTRGSSISSAFVVTIKGIYVIMRTYINYMLSRSIVLTIYFHCFKILENAHL